MELKFTDNLSPLSCSIDTLLQAWILHTPLHACMKVKVYLVPGKAKVHKNSCHLSHAA